jgi:hypothetical protein
MLKTEMKYTSTILSGKEKQRMNEILQGLDGIDKSKIVRTKQITNNELNLYIPEKWIYR